MELSLFLEAYNQPFVRKNSFPLWNFSVDDSVHKSSPNSQLHVLHVDINFNIIFPTPF
jgi:hypothetical protein